MVSYGTRIQWESVSVNSIELLTRGALINHRVGSLTSFWIFLKNSCSRSNPVLWFFENRRPAFHIPDLLERQSHLTLERTQRWLIIKSRISNATKTKKQNIIWYFKEFTTSVKLLFICMQEDIVVVESIVVDVHQSTRVSVFGNNVYEHLLPKYIWQMWTSFTLYFKSQGLFFDPLHAQRCHCTTPICSITMWWEQSILFLNCFLFCYVYILFIVVFFFFQITQLWSNWSSFHWMLSRGLASLSIKSKQKP